MTSDMLSPSYNSNLMLSGLSNADASALAADADRLRQFFESKLAGERAAAQRQQAALNAMLLEERAALDAAQRESDRHRFESERFKADLQRLLVEAESLRSLVSADASGLRRIAEEAKAEVARERAKREEAEAARDEALARGRAEAETRVKAVEERCKKDIQARRAAPRKTIQLPHSPLIPHPSGSSPTVNPTYA